MPSRSKIIKKNGKEKSKKAFKKLVSKKLQKGSNNADNHDQAENDIEVPRELLQIRSW